MGFFKHERKESEPVQQKPVQESVEPEGEPTTAPAVPAATEATAKPQAFGHMTELEDDGDLVITAAMAGLDPDKEVELSVTDGVLHIEAQHREEGTTKEDGFVLRELRYAHFLRTLPLPAGVSGADIKATYKDGVLEVRVPVGTATPETPTATRIPITTA